MVREYTRDVRQRLRIGRHGVVLANVLEYCYRRSAGSLKGKELLPASDGRRHHKCLAILREQYPSLPADLSSAAIHVAERIHEVPEVEYAARRLIGFLVTEISSLGKELFPDLVGLCQSDAASDKGANEDTLERVLEQLGNEAVEVRWDGLEKLHHELMGSFLNRESPFASLADWLIQKGYVQDEEAAWNVAGVWLSDQVASLDYPAARNQLRGE
jgi:hypothetical protein